MAGHITWDAIAPLVDGVDVLGRFVGVTFRCPVSGHVVPSRLTVPARPQLPKKRSPTQSLVDAVREQLLTFLRSMPSVEGAARRLIGDPPEHELTRAERREAIVQAFRNVSLLFTWDPTQRRWISKQAARDLRCELEWQLARAPVDKPYDRAVLARMLMETALSDGHLVDDERAFLLDYTREHSLESRMARPRLTVAELREVDDPQVRRTMLMLCWVLALIDEQFDPQEEEHLHALARGLEILGATAWARTAARTFLIDQALDRLFTWGHDEAGRHEFLRMAVRIGVDPREAHQAEAAYQRRMLQDTSD